MTNKFKVGDIVSCTYSKEKIFEVISTDPTGQFVIHDNAILLKPLNPQPVWHSPAYYELVKEKDKDAK